MSSRSRASQLRRDGRAHRLPHLLVYALPVEHVDVAPFRDRARLMPHQGGKHSRVDAAADHPEANACRIEQKSRRRFGPPGLIWCMIQSACSPRKERAMADIALTWIAPFVDPRGSNLWVLNPGTAEATITIYWFEAAGVLADKGEMTVGAGCLEGFGWWSTHPSGLNDPAPPDPP